MKGKKLIAIILVAVFSIAIVLIVGRNYFFPERPISVESVEFDHGSDSIVAELVDGKATIVLKYKVLPEDATNKNVRFISDSDFISVTDEGIVTVNGMRSGTITVITEDGNKRDEIYIFSRSGDVINVGYDFETNTFTESGSNEYIIDDDTLVLYSGNDYSLGIDDIIDAEDFSEYFDFVDGVIKTKMFLGESISLTLTIGDAEREIKIKIIDQTVLVLSPTLNDFISKPHFLNAPQEFKVGTGNDYVFEFSVIAQSSVVETEDITYRIYDATNAQAPSLLGTVEFESAGENQHIVANTVQFKSFNDLRFLSGAVGKKIRLEINYKYDSSTSKSFTFTINDGVNAATEAEFREYFDEKDERYWTLVNKAQYSVINIVKGFDATVPDYLTNPDGTIFNTYDLRIKYAGEWTAARLYTRVSPVVINGNFNEIDCSKLPLARAFLGDDNNAVEDQYADNGRSVTVLGFGRTPTILKEGDPGYLTAPYYYDVLTEGKTLFSDEMAKKFYDATPKHFVNDLSMTGNGGNGIKNEADEYIGMRAVTAITTFRNKLYVDNCYFEKVYSGITVDRSAAEIKLSNIRISDTGTHAIALRSTAASTLENLDIKNGGFAAIYCMAGSSSILMDHGGTETIDDIVPGAKAGKSMVYFKGFLNVDNMINGDEHQINRMGYADIANQIVGFFDESAGGPYSSEFNKFAVSEMKQGKMVTSFNLIISRDEVTSTVNYTEIDLSGITGYRDDPNDDPYNENAFMSPMTQGASVTTAFKRSTITETGNGQTTQLFGANVNASLFVPGMRNALSHFIVGLIPSNQG